MGPTGAFIGLAAITGMAGVAATAPAAVTTTASAPAATIATLARTATTSPPAASSSVTTCDDGPWLGPDGIDVNGRPATLDAGDRGAVYIWHNAYGWHLRTTDVTDVAHHYSGTIALARDARFTWFAPVRLENGDRVWVDGDNVLHYAFTTFKGIDGVDWTVSACGGAREHEAMRLSLDVNGHEDDPSRIDLGAGRQHPDAATFVVTRSV